jgi:hypothetical protein
MGEHPGIQAPRAVVLQQRLSAQCSSRSRRLHQSPHLGTRQYARILGHWVDELGLDRMEYGTHSMRRTKATLIYRRTRDLRAVQLLPGHSKLESTVRYLDTEVEDALEISEQTEIRRCRRRPPWKLRQGGRPKRPQCGAGPNWYFRPEADLGGVPAGDCVRLSAVAQFKVANDC